MTLLFFMWKYCGHKRKIPTHYCNCEKSFNLREFVKMQKRQILEGLLELFAEIYTVTQYIMPCQHIMIMLHIASAYFRLHVVFKTMSPCMHKKICSLLESASLREVSVFHLPHILSSL